jgi:hypothetical protein
MTSSNLRFIIFSLIATYAMSLFAAWFMPALADTVEKLALLVLGGLLAIMRPQSQVTAP